MTTARDPRPGRRVSPYGAGFDQVFQAELAELRQRWRTVYGDGQAERRLVAEIPSADNNLVGLAFSGGGIRSATFNLGLAQALYRHGVFDHVDYMSTVSGGGYLGSSISTAMRKLGSDGQGGFPFEHRGKPVDEMAVGEPREVETRFLTWVRNNTNYLARGGFLDQARIFGVLLRGMLVNFLVLLPFLLAVALGVVWYHGDVLARWEAEDLRLAEARQAAEVAEVAALRAEKRAIGGDAAAWARADDALAQAAGAAERVEAMGVQPLHFFVATAVAAGFLLLVLIFPVLVRVYKVYQEGVEQESSVASRGSAEKAFAIVLVTILVAGAIEALPLLICWFHKIESSSLRDPTAGLLLAGALAVLASAGTVLARLGGSGRRVALVLIGLLGLVIPLVVSLYVADDLIYFHSDKQGRAAVVETREFWESAAVPSPAYFRMPHEPMRLFEAPAARQDIRLLPGVLLLILGGGAGAALVGKLFDKGMLRGVFTIVGIAVGAFSGFLLLVLSSQGLDRLSRALGADGIRPDMLVLAMAVVVFFFCWVAVDVNLTGVLGLYRDRLAAAYLIGQRRKKDDDGNGTGELEIFIEPDLNLEELSGGTSPVVHTGTSEAAVAKSDRLRCHESKAPYHLVNATLNLQGSKDPMLRERSRGFFMFSKRYCGGHRTGYCETWRLEKVFPQMDLPGAMAISASAAAPNAGRMTSKPLVALMTLFNMRLGYWLPHPGRLWDWLEENDIDVPELQHRWRWRIPPWALLREMASEVHEHGKWVNVSDGGHIENLGVYELLRRRCKYILLGDAEADPQLQFQGLATLMRLAETDLGVKIEPVLEELQLDGEGTSRGHCAFARIRYPATQEHPEGEQGYLLHFKPTLTGDENPVVAAYSKVNPSFPHEATADQFFDEGQFDAYRALGAHSLESLFGAVEDQSRQPLGFGEFQNWFGLLDARFTERPSGIFICYRRDDTAGRASEIHTRLKNRFGSERVFFDLGDIEEGVDFRQVIDERLRECRVVLALIGPRWLYTCEHDRLDEDTKSLPMNPEDHPRNEIRAAMAMEGVQVLPVLLDGAAMPPDKELPKEIEDLSFQNAIIISDKAFEAGLDALVRDLERRLSEEG